LLADSFSKSFLGRSELWGAGVPEEDEEEDDEEGAEGEQMVLRTARVL
jgi:hypothetical protein